MKTKKSGAYAALAAVLLISAVLITSCPESFNLGGLTAPQGQEQTPFVPPPGKGYVRLNFGEGRTIRPAAFPAALAGFNHFDVIFTADDESATPGTTDASQGLGFTYANLIAKAFVLADGDYIVEVWAYESAHPGTAPFDHRKEAVVYGTTTVGVEDKLGTAATIALKEIKDDEHGGTGKFAWNLTGGANATSVMLTVAAYPGSGSTGSFSGDIIGRLTGATANEDIEPGVYNVTFALSGTGVKSQTIREILYIYQGKTSTYSEPLPNLSRNIYDVTYSYGDGRTNDGQSMDGSVVTEKVNHGAGVPEPSGALVVNVSVADAGKELEGWYTESAKTTKWNFATLLIRDLTLFANWVDPGVYLTFSWTAPGVAGNPPVITIHDIDREEGTEGAAFTPSTISRINPPLLRFKAPASGYSDYGWTVSSVNSLTSGGAYIDLDFANPALIDLLIAGQLSVQLSATHTGTNQPEISTISITVNNN